MTEREKNAPQLWPVFICYRRVDGGDAARRLYEMLHRTRATGPNGEPIELDVYFDREMPAVANWREDAHRPYLERARSMIVVCTPGSRINEGPRDWVHAEIDWWLDRRETPPILIDPLGEGARYVPAQVFARWPEMQRLALSDALSRQVIGTIVPGGAAVYDQELKAEQARAERLERTKNLLAWSLLAATSLAVFGYWQFAVARTNLAAAQFSQTVDVMNRGQGRLALARVAGFLRTDPDAVAPRALTFGILQDMRWPAIVLAASGQVAALAWQDNGARLGIATWMTSQTEDGALKLAVRTADEQGGSQPFAFPPLDVTQARFVSWSPKHDLMIRASDNDAAHFLDPRNGRDVGKPLSHSRVLTAAWSNDGGLVATGSEDGSVRVWHAPSGDPAGGPANQEDQSPTGPQTRRPAILALAWSADGARLAVGAADWSITVWDTQTWTRAGPARQLTTAIHALAWNPAGTRLASGDERVAQIWIWNAMGLSDRPDAVITHDSWVTSLAWNRDGTRLAAGSWDQTVTISDETGRLLGPPLDHLKPVGSVVWSDDGKFLATSAWEQVRVWPAESASPAVATLVHDGPVVSVEWNQDGTELATGSWDETARVSSATNGDRIVVLPHTSAVQAIAWSPDGTSLATVEGSVAKVWDRTSPQSPRSFTFSAEAHSVSWSFDGSLLAVASGDAVYVWDPRTRNQPASLRHGSEVLTVAWAPSALRIAVGAKNGLVRMWDTGETSRELWTKHSHKSPVVALAWAPDGRALASGSWDTTARIWNASNGWERRALGHTDAVSVVAWSPRRDELLTASWSGNTQVWNAGSGVAVGPPMHNRRAVVAAAWDGNGERVATGAVDGTVQIWSGHTAVPLGPPRRHSHAVQTVAWSPDGTRLATGSCDGTAKIWATPFASRADSAMLADVAEVLSFSKLNADSPTPSSNESAATDYNLLRAGIVSHRTSLRPSLAALLEPLFTHGRDRVVSASELAPQDARNLERQLEDGMRPEVGRLITPDWATIPHCSVTIAIARKQVATP